MSPQPAPGLRSVFRIPAFRRLWTAQFISVFGDFLAFFAVSSYISFRLHGTPQQVTGVLVALLVPFAVIGPVAGVFVDRWDPKRTMVASDLLRAGLVLALFVANSPWQIYIIFATISTVSSFFVPAQSVTTPLIVPRDHLISASAAMQQTFQAVRMLSPAVAGVLVAWVGERPCYALDSASFAASAALIGAIALPREHTHSGKALRSVVSDLNSGFWYVLTHRVIGFVVLSIAAGTFAISAFGSLLAIYVRDVLHAGPTIYGATGALVGAGVLAASVFVAPAARKMQHPARLILFGLAGVAVFVWLIASVATTVPALAACLGVGLCAALIIIPGGALLQSEPEPQMRGRVMSISIALMAGAQAIGIFFAGDLAGRYGIVAIYYASAVVLWLITIAGWVRLRKLT